MESMVPQRALEHDAAERNAGVTALRNHDRRTTPHVLEQISDRAADRNHQRLLVEPDANAGADHRSPAEVRGRNSVRKRLRIAKALRGAGERLVVVSRKNRDVEWRAGLGCLAAEYLRRIDEAHVRFAELRVVEIDDAAAAAGRRTLGLRRRNRRSRLRDQ
jgi:hypothetical protein